MSACEHCSLTCPLRAVWLKRQLDFWEQQDEGRGNSTSTWMPIDDASAISPRQLLHPQIYLLQPKGHLRVAIYTNPR
jgi:hypothetical protein